MKTSSDKNHATRQQWTQDFLQEYQLYRSLLNQADDDSDENTASVSQIPVWESRPPLADAAEPDMESLQSGQIRLLSQPDQMIWVLLLRNWGAGVWLVIPFSPFPYPATDEELYLGGRRTEYLNVLQFWNARTLHALFLRRSWLVDTLTTQEFEDADSLFDASVCGEDLPDELLGRTALPITVAPDLRIDYKQENLARFAALDAADFEWNELCTEAAETPVPDLDLDGVRAAEAIAERTPHFNTGVFAKLSMAAAGRSASSVCWETPLMASALLECFFQEKLGKKHGLTRHIAPAEEPEVFLVTENEMPNLLWKLPEECSRTSSDALFFHRESQLLLGTGYTVREGDEAYIVLADWCSDEHLKVGSPADITIFLTEPEQV